jgi:hypothetical protein
LERGLGWYQIADVGTHGDSIDFDDRFGLGRHWLLRKSCQVRMSRRIDVWWLHLEWASVEPWSGH